MINAVLQSTITFLLPGTYNKELDSSILTALEGSNALMPTFSTNEM